MNEYLLLLERLYEVDAELDRLRSELRQGERLIERTEGRIAEAVAQREEVDAQRRELQAQEQALQERIAKYVAQRDRTKRQLDEGLIMDLLVAEKQLENFAGIIDELELEQLDRMEKLEALDHKRAALEQRRRLLDIELGKQVQALADQRGTHEPRIAALEALRPEKTASLPGHLLHEYDDVRRSHRDALVPLKDGACVACHMHHPPQVLLEVRRGTRIHHCRGCHRFLVGIAEVAAPEAGESDAD